MFCRSPQQAVDFAKKSGALSLLLHPQLPLLVAHWHSFLTSSSVIAWEFCPGIGGGSGASGSSSVLSEWCELISASVRAPPAGGGSARSGEDASTHVAGVCWSQDTLICYKSSTTRSLFTLGITDTSSDSGSVAMAPLNGPSLCSKLTLSLEQYWSYQNVPSHLVQVTANPEPSSGAAEFVLHHASLQTGASEKLDDLPVWKSYQGKLLAPWTVVANHAQSVVCVKLRDRSKPQRSLRSAQPSPEDASFSYVVLELKEKAGGAVARRREDPDDGEGGGANFRVACGAQLEALDVCFADFRSEDARQSRPWVLVVLAITGKSLCFQVQCDQVESSRVLLQRDVLRVFNSPLPLSAQSPYASTVGSRLLYVSLDSADGRHVLQLSEDDLRVPPLVSASGSWKTSRGDEAIIDVAWNTSPASASSDSELLVAVRTTTRLVILTQNLTQVQAYDLKSDLAEPQSILWMAHTLLFVTKHNHLRYLTPLTRDARRSRLVCCLAEADRSTVQHTELLAVCGDRLAYSVTDVRTMDVRVLLRPISICEPLAAGFTTPNSKLKAIIERDVLVFVMTGGSESASPLTDRLLHVLYHDFGWKDATMRLLDAITNPAAGSGGASAAAAMGGGGASQSSYPKAANLSAPLLASLYLDAHNWRAFLKVFLASDPGLEEYALADEACGGASSAKLPSRTGLIAAKFRAFGRVLDAVGQCELALKCFDLAGDDLAIMEMAREAGIASSASSLVAALQRDWAELNPPLASLVSAEKAAGSADALAQLDSAVWRRHDLFSLLCCESLVQNERRSRLLASVKPFDKMTVASKKEEAEQTLPACPRASVLPWKRLAPEDTKDWIGVSATPHFSPDEPKNPHYGFSASSSSALGAGSSAAPLGAASDAGEAAGGDGGSAAASSGAANASAKMTIGPFVDEEDAVVAYWRFEEGAGLTAGEGAAESLDTSKRENNLQLLGFGTALSLVPSSAPVDKGEDGRVSDEYALRFPSSESDSALESEWGAKCVVRSGSTLDIGFVFDDDPYRRKLTFEAWLRNFALAQQQQQTQTQEQESDDFDAAPSSSSSQQLADSGSRTIVCRKSSLGDQVWWNFSLVDGYLVLEFAGERIKSDERVVNAAAWHHAAFSIDVHSPKQAAIKLFLQGRCVGAKDVPGVDTVNSKIYASAATAAASESSGALSYVHLGGSSQLRDYEVTEVRVWAAARTQEQLSDMKENYLGIAETKKRMKIAIHQRNCQCDKCHARRAKPAKLGLPMLSTPFPSTPPSSGSARDRRRPQPK